VSGHIRLLTRADIPAAMRLKEAAGWNQTETDWDNLLRLAPETCFGLECDGTLAATTTAVCHGAWLAWIGMVLTHPVYRGRGFARQLMQHTIRTLFARGVWWAKLDATEAGEPLYRALGFEGEGVVERWERVAGDAGHMVHAPVDDWREAWRKLDKQAFGGDRSTLIEMLAPLGAAGVAGEGYAMARPGSQAAYFGPCACSRAEVAAELVRWVLSRHTGERIYWDLFSEHAEAVRLARQFGFRPVRRLVRMGFRLQPEAPPVAAGSLHTFAIAGFEFG
jgi:GNAT superfamily N-acetyltransferase